MPKNTTQKNNTVIPEQDWWLFCDSYLSIAELSCREMLFQRYGKYVDANFNDFDKNNPRAFHIQNLYISMRYNLNHAIEIFLKSFILVIEKQIPDYKNNGHDISKYLALFQDKIEIEKINNTIRNANQNTKNSPYNLEALNSFTDFSDQWLESVVQISLKYFSLKDIQNKIKEIDLRDYKNDGFRYPENNISASIHYGQITKDTKDYEIKHILSDVKELRISFNNLKFLIYAYQSLK